LKTCQKEGIYIQSLIDEDLRKPAEQENRKLTKKYHMYSKEYITSSNINIEIAENSNMPQTT